MRRLGLMLQGGAPSAPPVSVEFLAEADARGWLASHGQRPTVERSDAPTFVGPLGHCTLTRAEGGPAAGRFVVEVCR